MNEAEVASALRDTFSLVLRLGAVPMLTILAVGLIVSLVQAVTQINEQTLAFVPKILSLVVALALSGHFLFTCLADYAVVEFDRIVAVGAR